MGTMRRGSWVGWLVAAAIGAAAGFVVSGRLEDETRVVTGQVGNVDAGGVGIDIRGEGYIIGTGLDWQGVDGTWRQGGQPECLPPGSTGAKVELGIREIPTGEPTGGGSNQVIWVRCLSLPTEVYGQAEAAGPLDDAYQRAVDEAGG